MEGISPRQFHYVALGPVDLTTFPAGHRSATCAKLQCSSRKAFSSSSIPCCVLFFSEFLFPSFFWVLSAGFCSLIRKSWNLHCRGLSNGCGVHVKCFQSWKMFECIQAILTADMANMASIEYQSNMSLNQLHGLKTSQNHNFQGAFECPPFPKFRLLRRQNFLQVFLPFCSVGFCLRPWASRPGAPEAEHRCIWQPHGATIRWSNGSSRPRPPWMRRTTWALASDEGFGMKDFYVRKWMNCWWFKSVGGCCFQFFWTNIRCFLSQLLFLHPFVCRQFLFWSILNIAIQNWFQIASTVQWTPTSWLLPAG